MAVMLDRFSRSLKEMGCTVEAVLLLMEMEEPAAQLERKLLWANETHISLLKKFDNMVSIHDARSYFVDRQRALLAAIPGDPTDKQKASIATRVKAMVSKLLDYHIVRSTEDIMSDYQSIVKIGAKSVKLCINGGGKLTFPSTVNLLSVTSMRLDYLSGEVSGRLPDTLKTLWINGVMRVSKMAPLTLNGISNLQVLCVTSCHVLKNLLQTWEKGSCVRVIMTLCRIHKCQCEALIKSSPLFDLPYKVIIVPQSRYNGKTLSENAVIQKSAFHHRVGIVFYKNLGSLKLFAECEFPADIGELYSERKRRREENMTESAF